MAAYTESFTVRRVVAAAVDSAYRACVRAWCDENLGLPVPPPLVWRAPTDPLTGRGLLLVRIPPAGLREGIIDARLDEWIHYRVLNPGWLTFPLKDHFGRIEFRPGAPADDNDGDSGNDRGVDMRSLRSVTTLLEWTVEYTPLAPWNRWWCDALRLVMRAVIERAVEHVARRAEEEVDTFD